MIDLTALERSPSTGTGTGARTDPVPAPAGAGSAGWRDRARRYVHAHRRSLLVLVPLLVLAGVLQGVNLYGSPQRIDDEGTYVAQAWSVFHLGELTHYTYWYDHPPLGWLQLAGYAELTFAFDRAPYAVAAGREFMLVVHLLSVALLWLLARRLDLPRWCAALAVLLFTVSPLAVQFHRTVYLDNIATPWLLGALALALSPRRRLAAYAGAGVCFAVAVLTKETSLLLLPVLGWLVWRRSAGDTRRYAIVVSAALLVLGIGFYALFALIKGEILPGQDRTSLLGGALFQLTQRATSGNVFQDGTLGNITLRQWLQLDLLLPALSVPAALGGLFTSRLRPFAVGFLILLAMIVRPGYLPVPFVIAMLPLAALLVAAAATSLWQARGRLGRGRAVASTAGGLALAVLIGLAVPLWGTQLRGFALAPLDRPMSQANAWAQANLPRQQRILTDDALWVDLVEGGFDRRNVVWFYKPDTDPAVLTGWQNYDWVISTDSMRSFPTSFATVTGALRNSTPVASFGSGDQLVEIRRVLPGGAPSAGATRLQREALAGAGQALVRNPNVRLSPGARSTLRAGQVDGRMLAVLGVLSSGTSVGVEEFPSLPDEGDGVAHRRIVIDGLAGRPVSSSSSATGRARRLIAAQTSAYRAALEITGTGREQRLVLTLPLDAG